MPPALAEQRDGSATADPWLPLLMGLVSLSLRLDGFLATSDSCAHDLTRDDEVAVAALLGIVSLRRRFLADFDALAPPSSPHASAREPRTRTSQQSLLR